MGGVRAVLGALPLLHGGPPSAVGLDEAVVVRIAFVIEVLLACRGSRDLGMGNAPVNLGDETIPKITIGDTGLP
jgi:hypothetical protein